MQWNSTLYDEKHAFVSRFGEDVLTLLNAQPSERILDLGCGTGHLSWKISEKGADVIGMDASEEMVAKAKASYPTLSFELGDARTFHFPDPFDAVFSNATLHWIPEAGIVAENIRQHLKIGGRLVVEFGGKGNTGTLLQGFKKILKDRGYEKNAAVDFWYFPSLGEYASLLEQHGYRVTFAAHFDRPTPLEGTDGVKNWLRMFGGNFLVGIPSPAVEEILSETQETLRSILFQDGQWVADYKRIRVVAVREN